MEEPSRETLLEYNRALENKYYALVRTLEKMKEEREDIYEKNTALEDACGKAMKEQMYLQQHLANAVNVMGHLQNEIRRLSG